MRKVALLILATVVLLSGTSFGAKGKTINYRAFTPTGAGKSVFVKSSTGQHKYFVIDKGTSFGFDVVGPTRIKIRTRAEMKPGILNTSYEVQVWETDKLVAGKKIKVGPSKLTVEGQQAGVGQVQTIYLKVPKGKHTYRLWLTSDKTDKYYVQFYQQKQAKKKLTYINYKPQEFKKQVNMKTKKGSQAYYLVDTSNGVSLSVVGPTKLQILCRANFSKEMKGKTKFTLGVYEGGREVAQLPGYATVSKKSEFKELPELIPSVLEKYTFNVPDGKHIYEFKKMDSAAPSLALRFKIQKNALGLKL